jgi:hypothetical protein
MDGSSSPLNPEMIGASRKTPAPRRILRYTQCGFGCSELRSAVYRNMDSSLYEAESARRARTAAGHLRIVSRYAKPPAKFLTSGLFLKAAMDAGWKVTGAEPAEVQARKARALLAGAGEVSATTLEMCDFAAQSFDAITVVGVLEQLPDSRGFLATGAALLKPGGWMLLNVPDLDSWEARLVGSRWPLLLPEHLNYFNRQQLAPVRSAGGVGASTLWTAAGLVLYRISALPLGAAPHSGRAPGAPVGAGLPNIVGNVTPKVGCHLLAWSVRYDNRGDGVLLCHRNPSIALAAHLAACWAERRERAQMSCMTTSHSALRNGQRRHPATT